MKKLQLGLIVILIILSKISPGGTIQAQPIDPPYLKYQNHQWVDSILQQLTIDQKIAQSIWVATWSNRDISHYIEINRQIETLGIGGLLFFQGTAEKQAELINQYQSVSKVPLAIAMDCEWGAGMRLDNIYDFPYQMTLGAIQNDSLILKAGMAIGEQLKRLGITVNFAPVADINSNPLNPVINYRSFGEDKKSVTQKTIMYSSGLQNSGILSTAKHFPGHGDTDLDSHYDLPQLNHSKERFDTLEIFPFRNLINNGIGAVMTAHLNIPSMGTQENQPSTLSPEIIKDILRGELGFKGLIITDAMNMQGVTKYYKPGDADAIAYLAGNDILEYTNDPAESIGAIKRELKAGKITIGEIDERCRRILAMKYWSGISKPPKVIQENIEEEVNNPAVLALIRELYASSLTLLANNNNTLPIKGLSGKRIAVLSLNKRGTSDFYEMVSRYSEADYFTWSEGETDENELINKLSGYNLLLIAVHNTDQRPSRNFAVTESMRSFLAKIPSEIAHVSVYFGNPYAIEVFKELESSDALIVTYQENKFTEELSAQLIFGAIGAHGKLPVTINSRFKVGYGLITPGNLRLQYGYPESAGISSKSLGRKIDSLAVAGLKAGAYPGCEVVAAVNGVVIFHKTYGYHTFENREFVEPGDIWDLASVTKITGALSGLMKLDDMGLFSTNETLATYWPDFKRAEIGSLKMDEILAHQAGLIAWIPFWKSTIKKNNSFKPRSFKYFKSEKYQLPVAQGIYLYNNYSKKMYRQIKNSPIGEKKYLYSGLTFYLYPEIISNLSGKSFDNFLREEVFLPIGANSIVFNPLRYYSLSRIIPTENDTFFRNQLIHGYVHDEGAAMMGGISGNAGLFSTANDLIKLVEMYRRMGNYGGEQIISEETLSKYSSAPFVENGNRRGLGFDKPQLPEMVNNIDNIYPCKGASPGSFGHSGYTGTFVWADPALGVSYVFLSNRVYPTRDNNLISEMNIRTEILQSIYDGIKGS
jgi:beta-glucosidase-like glycosyl hydrolase/CubicO group peptidase (beta-lactamase class C family)